MNKNKQKKPTNAQLTKRIANAVVLVDKTKDTKSIYFSEKGLRLTVNEDYAVIETGFHRHVFSSFTQDGVSRPYLYTKRIIEIANENDCKTEDGYSYAKLMQVLKDKEDQSDYNIATYYDWFLFNIFAPLYSIGENEAQAFMVYMDYMHNIAKNAILFEEHKQGLTNKQFIDQWIDKIREFTKGIEERQIFVTKSDDEIVKENIDALLAEENDKILQDQLKKEALKDNKE